jgi:CD2 antigen cytoplasmic tail-binding protein 2
LFFFGSSFSEGYERLAKARREGTSISAGQGNSNYSNIGRGLLSDVTDPRVASTVLPGPVVDTSNPNASTAETSSNDADAFDIFADDDEHATAKPSFDGSNVVSGPNSDAVSQPSADALNTDSDSKLLFDCLCDFQKIGTLPVKKKSLLCIKYC